jgi:hypothetical protein
MHALRPDLVCSGSRIIVEALVDMWNTILPTLKKIVCFFLSADPSPAFARAAWNATSIHDAAALSQSHIVYQIILDLRESASSSNPHFLAGIFAHEYSKTFRRCVDLSHPERTRRAFETAAAASSAYAPRVSSSF